MASDGLECFVNLDLHDAVIVVPTDVDTLGAELRHVGAELDHCREAFQAAVLAAARVVAEAGSNGWSGDDIAAAVGQPAAVIRMWMRMAESNPDYRGGP